LTDIRRTLKIESQEQTLIALIVKEGTGWMREKLDKLQNIIKMFMPDRFKEVDSEVEGYTFDSIRFDLYNRFAEKVGLLHPSLHHLHFTQLYQGTGAPPDVHPNYLYREGATKVNHSQRIPHVSEIIRAQPEEYEALINALRDICGYIETILSKHLPKEYHSLRVLLEQLPLADRPTTYPFGGFVLNIQVCTEGHVDEADESLCLVIPFGEYQGGDLVLWEPGLVLDLKQGDFILFPSSKITHFNLHFTGFRGSVVMHSDRELRSWADKNGWDQHMANADDFAKLYNTA
jgi:hypothetical protein